ncbi:crcB protein [Trichomonas vaginalis G3]|uniref:CrcB protein n=1 Tax=Trichomonas vaginalis (strain ATCC PRA-98 / G3) TaxID=412133 RepID=A2EQG0_TRIV3|nr:camphor resistance CrcB-like protein family [Trichomonas vaginalis G3]EAY05102.1 crcB protein [Trichomonas vaginalis G3]KAI5551468.1 camphor resistance CrcB-like protein family [Trichomonas vaginalis G3]|eukprot:XP_001317325.1 crcB protein [Trichomonas vaginalis G3]
MGIEVLYIAIGGAIGAVFRGVICILFDKCYKKKFPLAVFIINITCCFLYGILSKITFRKHYPEELHVALTTGFCGGYSTWSTFASQTFKLGKNKDYMIAVLNVVANHVVGFFFCWLGQLIGKKI